MNPATSTAAMPDITQTGYSATSIILFITACIAMLALDLFAHRKDKPIALKTAVGWSLLWVAVSMSFAYYMYLAHGARDATLFLTGYAVEMVLSVDNLMVFAIIFSAFAVPEAYRHRTLYYGVLGAILFRVIFVLAGTALYAAGAWIEIVFALIIAWTAVKMLGHEDSGESGESKDYTTHWSVKLTRRFFPVYPHLSGHDFFIHKDKVAASGHPVDGVKGRWFATPLFLCLIVVNCADIVFAFDSVPAIIGITREPHILYPAMIFAILGLRSMYFVLAALQHMLVHLSKAVIMLLFFIAFKLMLSASHHISEGGIHVFGYELWAGTGAEWPPFHVSPPVSLSIVMGVLMCGVLASLLWPKGSKPQTQ